jgi:hypothetical protein
MEFAPAGEEHHLEAAHRAAEETVADCGGRCAVTWGAEIGREMH